MELADPAAVTAIKIKNGEKEKRGGDSDKRGEGRKGGLSEKERRDKQENIDR